MDLHIRHILLLCACLVNAIYVAGQYNDPKYREYVRLYGDYAIQQANKHDVPASITLAQGILESNAGRSTLARTANNHFGIKCHNSWKGKKTYRDAEKKNECFRKYDSVADSYEDHSLFLTERSRYERLFKLSKTDYRGWAKGLQQCGYATDRAYANKLIKMIEDYELYTFDKGGKNRTESASNNTTPQTNIPELPTVKTKTQQSGHEVYKTYGLLYTIAHENDSYAQIASDLGFKVKKLATFNEVPDNFPLQKGDIVYLEKKKKKAMKPYLFHQVQVGESMHSISQYYGMRVKNLYKLNKKNSEYIPQEGETLKLR